MARIMELLKKYALEAIIAVAIGSTATMMAYDLSKLPPDTIKVEGDLTGDGIEDAVLYKSSISGVSARWRVYEGKIQGIYKELSLSQSAELILKKYGTPYTK